MLKLERTCSCCGVDISHKKAVAKFCSRHCKETMKARRKRGETRDYQGRTCAVCNNDISSMNISTIYCSNRCYHQTDAYKDYSKAYERSDRRKAHRKAYRATYRQTEGYAKSRWSINQKNSKLAARVNSMFTIATESQRHRLADWLLKVGHKATVYYQVDDWLADYNTSSI